MGVRLLVASALAVVLGLALVLGLGGCGDPEPDHGSEVPASALEVVDCDGAPFAQGKGNYDSGPEDVQGDARAALDDWLDQEGWSLPEVEYDEASRHGDHVLFTWTSGRTVLGAFVVRDDVDGLDDHRGWGVTSYAVCDPAQWPPEKADEVGIQVWTNADGDRVPTSLVQSYVGPFNCYEDMTYLTLGEDGRDGEFWGTASEDVQPYLRTTYALHSEVPSGARDTGYRREGRELWVDADAAYLVGADGDAERWPAPKERIACD